MTERVNSAGHPEGLEAWQESLADDLIEIGAIKFGAFRLKLHQTNKDAPPSPYYIDLRILPRHPHILEIVVEEYRDLLGNTSRYDACVGIPDAGNPLATAFSLLTKTPQIYIRKEAKTGYGIEGRFMTPFAPGENVLVIDDLITRADSKLETIKLLEEAGLVVKDVVVLVDREQGGAEQLAQKGYNLHTVLRFSQLLDYYHRTGKIDSVKYQEGKAYLAASR